MFSFFAQRRNQYRSHFVALMMISVTVALHAQGNATIRGDSAINPTIEAKVLIGLPDVDGNSVGDLYVGSRELEFTTEHTIVHIPEARILAVSAGDERVEFGGTSGKIARVLLPYGSGLALGAIAHKKVGLLTVEYLDVSGQYHGAVFVLKTQDVAPTMAALTPKPFAAMSTQSLATSSCPAWKVQPNTVRVQPISADDQSGFPAEDRVLLYEELVARLGSEKSVVKVYRAGDKSPDAQCSEFTVAVRATTFNKGDQAVRASLGPLGHFVGTTKLTFHLTIAGQDGTSILDQDLKKSEGSDSDSLDITKVISKSVVKNLKKSSNKLHRAQMA
jgi:hypothetical protein